MRTAAGDVDHRATRRKGGGALERNDYPHIPTLAGSALSFKMPLTPALDFNVVPIRLDVRVGSIELRDAFCWHRHRQNSAPSDFAAQLCRDLLLPTRVADSVADAISAQLAAKSAPTLTAAQIERDAQRGLLLLTLDLVCAGVHVVDSFGWNAYTSSANGAATRDALDGGAPDAFAAALVADLGVDASATAAVAVAIREQLWAHFLAVAANVESPIVRLPHTGAVDAISAHVPRANKVLA